MKRGLDQLTAWILAIFVTGGIFAGGYFVARLAAAHGDHEDEGESPSAHADDHGAEPTTGHEPAPSGEHAPAPAPESEHAPAKVEHGSEAPAHEANPSGHGSDASSGPNWEYKGSSGPDHWGDLAPQYKTCSTGSRQSPVDIDETVTNAKLLPIKFHYKADDAVVKNDGRTILANFPTGNYVEVDGERFDLTRIQFRAPSEHKVSGIPYDLEAQFEHRNVDGERLSISILFEEGEDNKALHPLFQVMPREVGQAPEPIEFDPATLLPPRRQFYTYTGSLTVPPCTEGVRWLVLSQPVAVAAKQVDVFAGTVAYNARPVQPLKGRKIAKSSR